MITRVSDSDTCGNVIYECYGLSTDTKPMDVTNASVFLEMDTKKVFMFDAENKVWRSLKD
jgi:hypothetical protein